MRQVDRLVERWPTAQQTSANLNEGSGRRGALGAPKSVRICLRVSNIAATSLKVMSPRYEGKLCVLGRGSGLTRIGGYSCFFFEKDLQLRNI